NGGNLDGRALLAGRPPDLGARVARRTRVRYHSRVRVRTLGLLTALLPAACASPPAGFDSPEPAARLAAITRAAEQRDETATPKLIEMLTSDDPVVRMAAIRTLERLTGTTMGYPYAD